MNLALKLKQLVTAVLPNRKLNEIQKVLEVIQSITSGDAVASGGGVADAILSKKWGIDYKARDFDIFVPVDESRICKYIEAVKQKGFISAEEMNTGMANLDDYGAAMEDVTMEVYKGGINGYPVDVVFVYCSDIKEYIMAKFDLDIKLAIFDGKEVTTSPAFKEAMLTRTVSVNHLHSPLSSFFRVIDAAERYNMQTDESFEWLADYVATIRNREGDNFKDRVRVKYRHLLPKAEKILEGRKPDKMKVMVIDLIRAWSSDVKMSKQASLAMKNIIYSQRIPSEVVSELEKIKDIPVKISSEDASWNSFIKIKNKKIRGWDIVTNTCIDELTTTVAIGMTAKEILALLGNITAKEYTEGKCTINGRQVRIGKLLNSLIVYIKKLHQGVDGSDLKGTKAILFNFWREELEDIKRYAHMFEIRLTEGEDCYLNISSDFHDLLTISTNKKWNSCQQWYLDQPTIHNRHLLANLNGRTLVAYLHKDGKWLARCILRLACDNNTVLYETVYSANREYNNQFVRLLKTVITEAGFKAEQATETELEVGPFDLPPYNQCYTSRTNENNQYKFKNIKPKNQRQRVVNDTVIPW